MKTYLFISAALFAMGMTACSSDEPAPPGTKYPTTAEIELSRGESECNEAINSFSVEYTNEISKEFADQNFVVSPLSMAFSMSMIANAVDDETAQSICEVLHCDNITEVNSLCKKLMQFLPDNSNQTSLLIANAIWHRQNITPNENFVKRANENFFCDVTSYDVDAPSFIDIVNSWCRENTNNRIEKAFTNLPSGRIFCLNTLYFNDAWYNKFDEEATTKQNFRGIKSDKEVDMMHAQLDIINYINTESWEAIKLPYKGSNEMVIIQPKADKDYNSVINALSYNDIFGLGVANHHAQVNLSMPKFESELSYNGIDVMQNLGVKMTAGNIIGFNGLEATSPQELPLYFLQNTIISTNETGSEAASVSAGIVGDIINVPEFSINFTLDRPFLYLVRNIKTGTIILAGQFVQP